MVRDQRILLRNKSVHDQEGLETDCIGEDRVENSKSALGIVVVVFRFCFCFNWVNGIMFYPGVYDRENTSEHSSQ